MLLLVMHCVRALPPSVQRRAVPLSASLSPLQALLHSCHAAACLSSGPASLGSAKGKSCCRCHTPSRTTQQALPLESLTWPRGDAAPHRPRAICGAPARAHTSHHIALPAPLACVLRSGISCETELRSCRLQCNILRAQLITTNERPAPFFCRAVTQRQGAGRAARRRAGTPRARAATHAQHEPSAAGGGAAKGFAASWRPRGAPCSGGRRPMTRACQPFGLAAVVLVLAVAACCFSRASCRAHVVCRYDLRAASTRECERVRVCPGRTRCAAQRP
jgi:hypothetical protein